MLFTLQRYEFFSKSQRLTQIRCAYIRCCLPYKGTNFSANHNSKRSPRSESKDVVYPTKVRIFQQITTDFVQEYIKCWMLFTLQRYEFFSKSQLLDLQKFSRLRCCLPYKGTNFSANHNNMGFSSWSTADVVYPTKVRIFQQITTQVNKNLAFTPMLFTLQIYIKTNEL